MANSPPFKQRHAFSRSNMVLGVLFLAILGLLSGGEANGEVQCKGDRVSETSPSALKPPHDPCLPANFNSWREAIKYKLVEDRSEDYIDLRIMIDRASYTLVFQGLRPDGSIDELYRSPVGLGNFESMTPVGLFHINHIYCYPDVKYFPDEGPGIVNLYEGLFAPLLVCDSDGRCRRRDQLGLHGLNPTLLPEGNIYQSQHYGPVSAGCVRLADPCGFKREFIRHAGIGPVRSNERGHYHWLSRPVSVEVVDEIGWSVFSSIISTFGSILGQ